MLLGSLFWYCKIQDIHTILRLRHLDSHQCPELSGEGGGYSVPRPPAVFSNDLRSLDIVSKTPLSIPHLRGGGNVFKCILQGKGENFLTLALQENYIPPHRKNDMSLSVSPKQCKLCPATGFELKKTL